MLSWFEEKKIKSKFLYCCKVQAIQTASDQQVVDQKVLLNQKVVFPLSDFIKWLL